MLSAVATGLLSAVRNEVMLPEKGLNTNAVGDSLVPQACAEAVKGSLSGPASERQQLLPGIEAGEVHADPCCGIPKEVFANFDLLSSGENKVKRVSGVPSNESPIPLEDRGEGGLSRTGDMIKEREDISQL